MEGYYIELRYSTVYKIEKTDHEKEMFSGTSQPYFRASCRDWPIIAEWCISFLGIQPTLTQVPPRPHLVPENWEEIRQ